jgi:predicted alpha/beta-fold hydrolase
MANLSRGHLPELKQFLSPSRYEEIASNIEKVTDACEYDIYVNVPLHGHETADNYYRKTKTNELLKKVKVPMFCMQSEDDFCVDPKVLPKGDRLKGADNVLIAVTKRGSHCCFFSGNLLPQLFVGKTLIRFHKYF